MLRFNRNRLQMTTLLMATVMATAVQAQLAPTLHYGDAGEAGMSAAVLAGGVGLFEEAVAAGDLAGAVLLVARNGRVVLHEPVGWRDLERQLPMERNTLFRMASNTKPVIGVAVAQLVEQDRLGFDDLVRDHIPAWDNYRAGMITIGHLLSHSTGLRIPTLFLRPMGPNPTLQSEVARFGTVGAVVPPGQTYSYNNPGYNTLAALIEIASGRELEAQLKAALYEPLGMEDSYNYKSGHTVDGKLDRMGPAYYRRDREGQFIPGGTPGGPSALPFARGSGGMISTAWDYAIFCQMMLNGGTYDGRQYLQEATVRTLTTPKILAGGQGENARHYGYGWSIRDDVYSHNGSDGTYAWVDPERGIVGLVFTQTPSGNNPRDRFQELVNLSINR